ncbi:MAG: endonuclease/exonuclease/phosphatase family protein [Ornithinimicrobium sp.]
MNANPGGRAPTDHDQGLDSRVATQLRVATYNLRALADDPRAAAQVLRSLEPDVVLLQEIPRGLRSASRMNAFARECRMTWPGRTRRVSGTSLMLGPRARSTRREDRALPVEFAGNPRTYSLDTVWIGGTHRVVVASIHLPLRAEQRRQHIGQILAEMTVRRGYERLPWVIGGDLNEGADEPAWRQLASHVPLVSSPSRPTFPATAPRRAIDAIFATGADRVQPAQQVVVPRRLLVAASDHDPVWVDLSISSDASAGAVVAGAVSGGAQHQQHEAGDGADHAKHAPGDRVDGREQGAEEDEQRPEGQSDDNAPEVQVSGR